jgi:hypothetical protein
VYGRINMSKSHYIKEPTKKKLYAKSGNKCAMYGCDVELFPDETNFNSSEIAHIEGVEPNSARHNPDLADDQVNAYDNLISLCLNHHNEIDAPENTEKYTVEFLKRMKKEHEDSVSYKNILMPPEEKEISIEILNGIVDEYYNSIAEFFARDTDSKEVSVIINSIQRENINTRFILYSIIVNSRVKEYDINMFQTLNQVNNIDDDEKAMQLMVLEKNEFISEHRFTGDGDSTLFEGPSGEIIDYSDNIKIKFFRGQWCFNFYGKIIYAWYEFLGRDKKKFFDALVRGHVNNH